MATKKNDKSITNLFGSIAAAQTMVEQFPFSFGMNESGFTCTFDLLATIFNLISDEPLANKVVNQISEKLSDDTCSWLQHLEDGVKLALETNLTSLFTCEMSPIIPDRLIGSGEFLEGSERAVNFQGEGITIPVSAIDFTGMLGNCPADPNNTVSTANYFTCYQSGTEIPLTVDETWKHDDFNAFLWFVKNKGVYGNLVERQKLIWDNRYKTKPFVKYERKPEHFFTMKRGIDDIFDAQNKSEYVFPFSPSYLKSYNNNTQIVYKKKQILECRYIDGDGIKSDSFQFRLPASNYYKTRKLTGKNKDTNIWAINKTIFEFNHDFLMSIKLFDAKTYLCQMINSLLGVGNVSFNFSVTRENENLDAIIDGIIDKVINLNDTEIEDCYFTFSNDEYDQMIQNATNKRRLAQINQTLSSDLINEVKEIEKASSTPVENKAIISNVMTQLTREMEENNNDTGGWKFNYNLQFELIRMIAYPLIKPLFSPKVMTLLLINLEVMGNPLELGKKILTFDDIKPYFTGFIVNIIIQIKDMINEMLYTWVIEKLTPLLTLFTLRLLMEQVETYRKLITDLLTACAIGGFSINSNKRRVGIDNVDYADIDPELEKLKQTSVSQTNC